jgi:hypothetical protein
LIFIKGATLGYFKHNISVGEAEGENTMTGASEQSAVANEPLATDVGSQLIRSNKYAFSLLAGTRNVLLDQMVFAGNEFLERTIEETRIFNEFLSKLAEAHSVKNLGTMYQECTTHQLEFIRRDTERLVKHSGRVIDNTSKLVESWRQN